MILRRGIGRGRGIAIKSFPDLKEQYFKKVEELNPDAVFILDKAEVSREFIEAVEERGVPITWIDHHESQTPKELIVKSVNKFNYDGFGHEVGGWIPTHRTIRDS